MKEHLEQLVIMDELFALSRIKAIGVRKEVHYKRYITRGTTHDREFWAKVMSSDEVKFNIFRPGYGNKVWQKRIPKYTKITNAPKHTSHNANFWKLYTIIQEIFWKPQSPDRNPIGHL